MAEGDGNSNGKPKPLSFARSVEVEFAGKPMRLAPLKGIEALRAFEAALTAEVQALEQRVKEAADGRHQLAGMLAETVDSGPLLVVGSGGQITEELIAASEPGERLGVLTQILYLNNLGRYTVFLAPELLLETSMRLSAALAPDFPTPGSESSSSVPASAGSPSSTS